MDLEIQAVPLEARVLVCFVFVNRRKLNFDYRHDWRQSFRRHWHGQPACWWRTLWRRKHGHGHDRNWDWNRLDGSVWFDPGIDHHTKHDRRKWFVWKGRRISANNRNDWDKRRSFWQYTGSHDWYDDDACRGNWPFWRWCCLWAKHRAFRQSLWRRAVLASQASRSTC